MSARRDITSGLTIGLTEAAILGVGIVVAWKVFAPQLLAFAGAAGSAAGEQASNQITSGVSGAAPQIGQQIGSSAVEGAENKITEGIAVGDGHPVTMGGTTVEVLE